MENQFVIKVKSYKNSKSFFGGLIRFKQRYLMKMPQRYSRISHSELEFCFVNDDDVIKRLHSIENAFYWKENLVWNFREKKFSENWLWFSSSETDWGSRFKFIEDDKWHWVSNSFSVTKEEYLKILDFCIIQEGQAYNWLGIIFHQTLWIQWFRRYGDWFCSQITLAWIQQMRIFCWIDAINISPWQLLYLVEKNKLFK